MIVGGPISKPVLVANAAKRIASHDPKRALKWISSALSEFPDHPALTALQLSVSGKPVPSWHFPMMNDTLRNAAYRTALIQLIRPGMRVFEIGTGAGLLAMMAARAGASHVVTCEANEQVARVAQQVIEDNGLSEKITVIPRKSTDINVEEIGGHCDLLITETFDATLIGEGALPSIKHARQMLIKKDGLICPLRGFINAQLVRRAGTKFDVSQPIEGFDLSAFAQFEPKGYLLKSDDPSILPIGAPVTVASYDFSRELDLSPREYTLTLDCNGASFDGLAIWMGLELADGVEFECPPGSGSASHWGTSLLLKPASMQKRSLGTVTVKLVLDVDIFQAWFVV